MQRRKRIVSKSEYLAYLARKKTLGLGAVLLGMGGKMLVVFAFFCGIATLSMLCRPDTWSLAGFLFPTGMTLLTGYGAWAWMKAAIETEDIASNIEPVIPQTRLGIKQLAAEETLVRASAEPTLEQEKVLLRATIHSNDAPAEQLLRPGNLPE
jgi:hypothetical protein